MHLVLDEVSVATGSVGITGGASTPGIGVINFFRHVPSPRNVQLTYNQGLLTNVSANGVGYGSMTYHPNLLVSQVTHSNGVTETQANDPNEMRRPSSLSDASPYASWSSGTYAYDGAGNVKSIGTATFTYDKVSRLTSAGFYDGPTGTGNYKQQSYTFDAYGNLTGITTNGVLRNTPTSTATNRLTGAVAYDAAGNLTSWNGAAYQYDRFNQMVHMTSGSEDWTYLYTADDERIWSYSASLSRWTLRDLDGKVLREYLSGATERGWSLGTDYLYRDGLLLAAETQTGRRHFHLDHLGTPRLITRASGDKASYHAYYPFGEEATAFNQDTERMKFTGHERDLASAAGAGDDLDYMHQRFCNPLVGRFLKVDPINSGNFRQPQSWNKYSYVYGNPLKYIDPDGKKAIVHRDGNKIHIEIPVRFVGKGATPERIAAFKTAVESKWSGTFGKFEVTTEVTKGGILDNRVKLETTPGDNDKNVSAVRASRFAVIYTERTPELQAEVDAHEAGHLMYLDDKYNEKTGEPLDGWDNNIMAELPGDAWELNFEELLDRMSLLNPPTNPPVK